MNLSTRFCSNLLVKNYTMKVDHEVLHVSCNLLEGVWKKAYIGTNFFECDIPFAQKRLDPSLASIDSGVQKKTQKM